jgi:hypothetical protein
LAVALSAASVAGSVLAGCSAPTPPTPTGPSPTAATQAAPGPVNPERIRRVRTELPADYEVADVGGYASTPVAFWGFGHGYSAQPPQCGALVDPAPQGPASGLSASGPGGILHVVVVSAAVGPVGLDPVLLGECGQWLMTYGRSSAEVNLVDAPVIAGAATVGLTGAIHNVVESGTETASRADTFMAYLGEHVVFVTLVTDPGSVEPPLPPQFASDLLVKTVATLRG